MIKEIAKAALVLVLVIFTASAASAQQTTSTDCTINGSNASCTSTTSGSSNDAALAAQIKANADAQARFEQNLRDDTQKIGNAFAARAATKQQEKNDLTAVVFCRQNPSGNWTFPGKAPMECPLLEKNVVAYCTVNAKTPLCKDVAKLGPAPAQALVPVQQAQAPVPVQEAPASIESPKSETSDAHSGFPSRWKSLTSGSVRTLRFENDYIYGEAVLSEAAVKAGVFFLMEVKKDGDKYVGKQNGRVVRADRGASCSVTWPFEFTLVTPDRIEGRSFAPSDNAKIDWNTCSFSPSADWRPFTWIPVK